MSDFSIRGFIGLDHSGVTQALRKSHGEIDKFKHDSESFTRAIGAEIGGTIFGWVAGVASLEGMVKLLEQTMAYASEIKDMSLSLGVDPTKLQEYGYALRQSGGDLETFARAMLKIAETREKAIKGDAEAIDSLKKVGLTAQQVKGMSGEEIFDAMSASIKATKNETDQLALSFELFGKGGPKILTAIKEGLEETRNAAHEKGQIISEYQLGLLDQAEKKVGNLWMSMKVGAANAFSVMQGGPGEFLHEFLVGLGQIDGTLKDAPTVASEGERGAGLDKKLREFNAKKAAEEAKDKPKVETEKERQEREKKAADEAVSKAKRIDKLKADIAKDQRKLALESLSPEERLVKLKEEQAEAAKLLTNDEEKRLENQKKILGLSEEIRRAEGEVARANKPAKEVKERGSLTENQRIGAYSSSRTLSIQQEQLSTLKTIAKNTNYTAQTKPLGGPKFS